MRHFQEILIEGPVWIDFIPLSLRLLTGLEGQFFKIENNCPHSTRWINIPGPQAEILFFPSVEDERDLKT